MERIFWSDVLTLTESRKTLLESKHQPVNFYWFATANSINSKCKLLPIINRDNVNIEIVFPTNCYNYCYFQEFCRGLQ